MFKVEDLVRVSAQTIKLGGNPKLLSKLLGPFNMMKVHCNSYWLCFPNTIQVHPIMNVSFLKPVIPLVLSHPPCAIKAPIIHEDIYEVNEVVDH